MFLQRNENLLLPRRNFLGKAANLTLSASAIGLLAGQSSLATAQSMDSNKDVAILNVALGLEHEAIGAYQLGAESGLLQKGVLNTAVLFQSHHKGHRDALIATIEKLGGRPVATKSQTEYATALNAGSLKNQGDVVELARKLELGAVNAYLGVIPAFKDSALAKVAGRLAADETMHWALLSNAVGKPVPTAALYFGA